MRTHSLLVLKGSVLLNAGLAAARLVLPGRTCRTPGPWTAPCPIFLGLCARLFPSSYTSAVNAQITPEDCNCDHVVSLRKLRPPLFVVHPLV